MWESSIWDKDFENRTSTKNSSLIVNSLQYFSRKHKCPNPWSALKPGSEGASLPHISKIDFCNHNLQRHALRNLTPTYNWLPHKNNLYRHIDYSHQTLNMRGKREGCLATELQAIIFFKWCFFWMFPMFLMNERGNDW